MIFIIRLREPYRKQMKTNYEALLNLILKEKLKKNPLKKGLKKNINSTN